MVTDNYSCLRQHLAPLITLLNSVDPQKGVVRPGCAAMISIQKLLSRIRWDPAFGDAFFEIEYEDRIVGLIRIPLEHIFAVDAISFSINHELDGIITIPLHRVKCVYRNGNLIWSRIRHE
jgi:uncharacterized protein (UPF0248 family)